MASVELRAITKQWGDTVAVKDFDLKVGDGEFLVLLGPSGCGKTTSMRMVAGLEDPTAGSVHIGSDDVTDLEPKDRDVAMVFQSYALYPNLTVRGNIGFPLKVRKVADAQAAGQIEEAAGLVEIVHLLDRKPAELSGGQRQRVALARAIIRKPKVFLMDEPLSNLDARLRISMRAQIKNLQHSLQTTTIYVTHDQIEAMTLADRVAVMYGGKIQQLAAPEEIYDRPGSLFVAGFIGSPPMNLIEGEVADGTFACADFKLPGVQARPGPAVLGIRPEDVTVCSTEEGLLAAPVYALELTGEATLVTVDSAGTRITARGDRRLRCADGDRIGLRFGPEACRLFDPQSEQAL